MAWSAQIQAWIYPGTPAQNANEEYSDGRVIRTLKPEYYTVNSSGVLVRIDDVGASTENGYSVSNAADVKSKSTYQYMTISSDAANMATLCADSTKRTNAINTIKSFLDTIGFTGVELDWEGFGSWTSTSYADYKTFVTALVSTMHANNYKVMIDGPPIGNVTEQGYYQFKYEDFESIAVDYICVMAYDYQYDYGGGESVAPKLWVDDICDWVKGKLSDDSRIVIGMPSYGYHATTGGFTIVIDTKTQSAARTAYGTATRNADYEMEWANGGVSSIYQDTSGMNSKRTAIEAKGIQHVSVWHLGGNDWFTGAEPDLPGGGGSGRTPNSSGRSGSSSRGASSGRSLASARSHV